jgi:hypothetical protein
MNPRLTWEAVEAMIADRRRTADSPRSPAYTGARKSPPRDAEPVADPVTVRFATPKDARAIEHLAQLDSADVPMGPALVAEIEGELVAMLPLGRDGALADPFRETVAIVHLLELRKAQLTGHRSRSLRFALRRPGHRRAATARL